VALEPTNEFSEELAALIQRADIASEVARRLLDEKNRWRRSALWQLDYMFERGAEIQAATRHPAAGGVG
jgi:hypothetical protein